MGNILNTAYTTNLEQNMRELADSSFSAVQPILQHQVVSSILTDQAESVQLFLPVDAETIDHGVDEGEIQFSKLEELNMVFNYQHSTKGLRIKRSQFTDGDRGAKRAADWARKMGADAAYTPEKLVWNVVTTNAVSQVDSLALFHNAHLNNPKNSGMGTYANKFSSTAASGSANNPGALRIDIGVDAEDAFQDLGKALAAIRMVKCADGVTPRHLRAKYLIVDPANEARARLLTGNGVGASTINSTDVSTVRTSQGLQVIVVPELSVSSNQPFYLGCEEIAGSELGAVIFWEREPFTIQYLDGMTDSQLAKANELEWYGRGRESAFAGIPFKLFRVDPV